MHIAYIAFGSNIGDKENYIKKALEKMQEVGMNVVKVSNIYETEPYGVLDQDNFLNGVAKIETNLEPENLIKELLDIEKQLDRVRKRRWGPRTIDLDIIFYDDLIINEKDLVIPHKDMENREFVLKPLCDIDENFIHPVLKKSVRQLYDELKSL
ncbi:2-amino-4-hydroxy-6-hydroxymethyldihydropteridine diphosphokinase [Clostridium tepidum]|jgi:2-amino-4-hydroxy-6-hydroxymethyldihydropteridine diphosphokinase|uniref:2-amino-4-hydroxy-6-hydroxymethyldihydropteridine diphosphokinase n=1 Tax=Clostridium tepidum TaxID=1962263 RepID=A0A1S9I1W4_9CLOT|nr:2-amino-4-hydroxy-6-hydroxymethyldihydropteridine diphosphokinase [Clostridium tepidum]MCR1934823.1 2-amino-4-hydroxy-6-hydroxymethyldihydropteridine diphosphokinase [Clostridium tepidum]MDU6878358.1 2-amino-4-hydroxy-6-hydroxymethyldihydropteridine diphosphokinase [Clostridium botulinum]OOO62132.1 2-amino-4-hydroxy-6-hydroxymethyldihydropteridine diphosphokinase [Clostridium tepidum]OOO64327.1 2-amino-4-hydroxy-6-hydroxymethyldihydropteridine diphosphokinase [Clostridium tepidum]